MAEGSQRRILQIWLFPTLPNPQTPRLNHYDVHWKSFSWIPHLPNFCSNGFGGRRHCEQQEQQEWEDQGVHWHEDVSLQLEFSLTRMWCAVVMVVEIRVFLFFQHVWPHLVYVKWWSTTPWTARTTWRRLPGRLLTIGCITSVRIFFN